MNFKQMAEVYVQDTDAIIDKQYTNEITVEVHDHGGGPYLVIQTSRWAIDRTEIAMFTGKLYSILERVEQIAKEENSWFDDKEKGFCRPEAPDARPGS